MTELAIDLGSYTSPDFARLHRCNCAKSGDHKGKNRQAVWFQLARIRFIIESAVFKPDSFRGQLR